MLPELLNCKLLNAKSTGMLWLVKLKMHPKMQPDKMLHPCVAMVRLHVATRLLQQPTPMRWELCHTAHCCPYKEFLQAAWATLPKNRRWGKEAESDSPKDSTGCKIQSQYPQSSNIWTCVHSITWLNGEWVGFAGSGLEDIFYLQRLYKGGKRYWQQWHFLTMQLCRAAEEKNALYFSFFFPICPFVNNFLARVVCEQVLALTNVNILSKADGETWYGLGCTANTSLVAPSNYS